jgi:HEAT repeat protein
MINTEQLSRQELRNYSLDELMEAVRTSRPLTVQDVVFELGDRGTTAAHDLLLELFLDPNVWFNIRGAAASELSRTPQCPHYRELVDLLASHSQKLDNVAKTYLLRLLNRDEGGSKSLDVIFSYLLDTSEDITVRVAAAKNLEGMGKRRFSAKIRDFIITLLKDSEPEIRFIMCEILSQTKYKEAIPALLEMSDDSTVTKQSREQNVGEHATWAASEIMKNIEGRVEVVDPTKCNGSTN